MTSIEFEVGTLISEGVSKTKFCEILDGLTLGSVLDVEILEADLESIVYCTAHKFSCCHLLPKRYEEKFLETQSRVGNLLKIAKMIGGIFKGEETRVIALKNTAIALSCGDEPANNPMGDIDLFVCPSAFNNVVRKLLDSDFYTLEHEGEQGSKIEKEDETELGFLIEGVQYIIEIQTRPVSGRWISHNQEPNFKDLESDLIRIPGTGLFSFSPEYQLLLVALHTAKHSYVRAPGFRLHTDVDRIVSRNPIDWDRFVGLASRYNVKAPVYFSLLLAVRFLGTNIPGSFLNELQPSSIKRTILLSSLKRVGFLRPMEPKWNRLSYIIFVLLLFDRVQDLAASVLPDREVMKLRYGGNKPLSYLYALRLLDLLFNRKNF